MSVGYVKSLDGVRAIAIILVMTFHAGLNEFGWMGVQLFFVLSGFLITRILWSEKHKPTPLGHKFKKFWVRRSLRIFPLYFGFLIALGISYLIFHFPDYYKTFIPYLSTYTFNYTRTMPDWEQTPLFTHLWSLSIEEQFYLFFPLLIFFGSKKLIKILMVAIVIFAPLIRYLLGEYFVSSGHSGYIMADAVYWHTASHLDAFFCGGLITVLSIDKKISRTGRWFTGSLLLAIAAGAISFFTSPHLGTYLSNLGYGHGQWAHYEHVWTYTLLNFAFAMLILHLISQERNKVLSALMESSWMVRIGRVSYGMYIFHWAILYYVFERLFPTTNFWYKLILFLPYLLAVYLFSELSYRLFESKFIQLKDRFFPDKKNQSVSSVQEKASASENL